MNQSHSRSGGQNEGELAIDPAAAAPACDDVNHSESTRIAILDAVVRCFAAQGWAGTNMSLVARETGMTRGKIQYYYPVLEDLKYAAIEHLHERSRRNYFAQIRPDAPARERFDMGIDLMWELARDPLHMAMTEVGAAARTDAELRSRLASIRAADEAAMDRQAGLSFPALAAVGQTELHLGRLFTTVFINGLAAHGFAEDPEFWRARLIAMLKECLADFWVRRGVTELLDPDEVQPPASATAKRSALDPPARDLRREEALALIHRATMLLSED